VARNVETTKLVRVHHLRWVPTDFSGSVLTSSQNAHEAQRSLIVQAAFDPAEAGPAQRAALRLSTQGL